MIWIISTAMTRYPGIPDIQGLSPNALRVYKNQKRALEEAFDQLKGHTLRMCLIRPGAVATQSYNQAGVNAADVNQWVSTVCGFYIAAREHNLWIDEMSLGFRLQAPDI
jgi:hypothetical protein